MAEPLQICYNYLKTVNRKRPAGPGKAEFSAGPDTRPLPGGVPSEDGDPQENGAVKDERKDTTMKKAVRILTFPVLLALLIAMVPAALADPTAYTKEELAAMTMVVTTDYVNMRGGYAGTPKHKEIINYSDGLMKGEKVYCLDKHNGWYCVLRIQGHKCTVGWVWGDFVKFMSADVANGGVGDVSNGSNSKYVGGTPATDVNSVRDQYYSQYTHVIYSLQDNGMW